MGFRISSVLSTLVEQSIVTVFVSFSHFFDFSFCFCPEVEDFFDRPRRNSVIAFHFFLSLHSLSLWIFSFVYISLSLLFRGWSLFCEWVVAATVFCYTLRIFRRWKSDYKNEQKKNWKKNSEKENDNKEVGGTLKKPLQILWNVKTQN